MSVSPRNLLFLCLLSSLLAGCFKEPLSSLPDAASFSQAVSSEPDVSTAFSECSLFESAGSDSKKENSSAADLNQTEERQTEKNTANSSAVSAISETSETAVVETADGLHYKDRILIVNKKYGLPADYAPGTDPQAASQMEKLLAAMQSEELQVSSSTSNFRSYAYQNSLYQNYVSQYGQQQADTFSARAGFSEHQSGLAFDLLSPSGQLLTTEPEVQWLQDNAWKYGFIVRYLPEKEAITGYQAEPWHLRYIGEKAEEIAKSGLCLEEYLGVEGGDYR